MTAALGLSPAIDVRLERREAASGRPVTDARFVCRCGWTTRSSGRHLVVPDRVKAHARACPHAHPGQTTLEDLGATS